MPYPDASLVNADMPGATHTYHVIPGKAHAGLARAVWELNPVGKTDGGTMFISGSHSAHPPATPPRAWSKSP